MPSRLRSIALVREAANVVKGFPGHSLPIGGCTTWPGHAIRRAKKHTKKLKKIEMGHIIPLCSVDDVRGNVTQRG